jgi:hypothetical protein
MTAFKGTHMSDDTIDDRTVGDRDERARESDPRYSGRELVRVARATNQAEAEFLQGLLLEHSIPSTLLRSPGFDVPDMLAAGPRDVMVPAARHAMAREVLLQTETDRGEHTVPTPPARALAALPARWLTALLEFMRIYPPAGGG